MMRLVLAVAATLLCACAHVRPDTPGTPPADRGSQITKPDARQRGLKAFESLEELRQLMASVTEARRLAHEKELAKARARCRSWANSDVDVTIACSGMESSAQTVTVTAASAGSITNNQHPGLDEGDIVKRQGDMLIVLRRGRLFTIGIGGRRLDSLAVADAFGPASEGIEPRGTWYDELLIWERTVVVIGYSYERGGTEIGLFDLGDRGELQHRATYHLRSNDYYSSRNYASRLMGDRLVLFTSLWVREDVNPHAWLPALRRWGAHGTTGAFETIAPIDRVFRPVAPLGAYPSLHTMISCNLAAPSLECEATAVLGDALTAYYASPTAAYAWTTAWNENGPSRSMLYRMPFDGAPVSAIGVAGYPADQLAFLEDAQDHLNVVVGQEDKVVSLLRLPLYAFSDGSVEAPAWSYRPLARGQWVTARFVGDYVIVGTPTFDPHDKSERRVVVTTREGTSSVSLKLTHAVERIEPMGAHAVVVGNDDDRLSMTSIRLGNRPTVVGRFVQPHASQSEYRSHAFFYRQDSPDEGLFGLPVAMMTTGIDDDRWDRPARILFIHNRGLTFSTAGTLDPSAATPIDDGCRASCIDWYGNARPIFIDRRVFALSGYDMVEGHLVGGRVEGINRLNFTPQ